MPRLTRLHDEFGQSPWLDNLKREYLSSGELETLRQRGVRGLTSNPTIFQKAIDGSAAYDTQFRALIDAEVATLDAYWAMVLDDIDGACDVLDPVFEDSDGVDGYVSVEVDPRLAHDTSATVAAARDLHERVGRRNLMVKIPGTEAGLPAIRQMIAEGRNINVTLIFGLDRYQAVMEAYLDGLEAYADSDGSDLTRVASVASFFISRVDSEVDRRLEAIGTDEAQALQGRAAIAQAQLAYKRFQDTFSGPRWNALAAKGARVQRPLWASTSTKNPDYPDTLYVDRLIGPNTVTTLPEATLEAFVDHGELSRRIDAGVDEAERLWNELADVGVDMDDVAVRLEHEGVAAFEKSFDELLATLEAKRGGLR
ncbi:MAG: transaldolase [Nitriliruptorales bacterium]|nr:transaldolase [Nitriliruptorales bacterium]